MKINFRNKDYTEGELKKNPVFAKAKDYVIAVGPGLNKGEGAFAFASEKEFINWSRKRPVGKSIAAMYKDIGLARKEEGKNTAYIRARQIEKATRVANDLRALAKQTGLRLNSKALFLRATTKTMKAEGPIFDPVGLYTGTGFTGNSLGAAIPLPNLNWWPGLNNTISSVQILGACILYSGTFFSGASRVLIGVPYMQITNLANIGFNNVTSSVYVYPL
jgi:hypothetical protein